MSRMDDNLGALQLLAAMYPLAGELELSESAQAALRAAESGEEYAGGPLDLVVCVPIDDNNSPRALQVAITLSDSPARIAVRQPDFLPRTEFSQLEADLPQPSEDDTASDIIMSAIEYLRSRGSELAEAVDMREEEVERERERKEELASQDDGELCRVWLWLPGLDTKEKIRDIVEYAPGFRLTGFVLAGKPGLICLEGGGKAVDRYMSVIKSESWGDVPSFQKKVTERLRRPLSLSERKFKDMCDITGRITHYGRYNHRGDMGEVKKLMDEWGVGDDFGAAVMNVS